MKLTVAIQVPTTNVEQVIDAVNETLNALAHAGVIDDGRDNAWAWNDITSSSSE